MLRSMLAMAVFAFPAFARADDKVERSAEKAARTDAADEKLAALEAKLQGLLKEIQALRGGKGDATVRFRIETPKGTEKKDVSARIQPDAKDQKEKIRAEIEFKDGKRHVVIVGKDGKPLVLDAETMKGLKLGELNRADVEKLKGQWLAQAEKLAVEKLSAEKLAGMKKAVTLESNADKIKSLVGQGKRVVVIEDGKEVHKEATGAPPAPARHSTVAPGTFRFELTGGDTSTIHLTRVTYTLTSEQARALGDFLKAFVKASVLETRVDGDKLVVTTTPEVQATIGQVVALMTGKRAGVLYRLSPTTSSGTTMFFTPKTAELPKATITIPVKPEKK